MEFENYFNDKSKPGFDCSICLDFPNDPVVTLCGHLYCWPCIYKWLSFPTTSTDSVKNLLCPVCKSQISQTSVVPLYVSDSESDTKKSNTSTFIPPRPHPSQQFTYRNSRQTPYGSYDSTPENGYNSNVWMYGEMIYARVFGNSESLYMFPNSYHLAGRSNPRLRRQEMEVHRSLDRLTMFLFCCLFMCLLLF